MANRYFEQFFLSFTKKLVGLHGYIDIAADSSVSGFSIKGVTSVTKSGTGEYTIVLDDQYNELQSLQLTLQAATPVNLVPQIESADVVSTKTIVLNLNAGATPTNPAAVCRVYVAALLRNSSVG